MSKDNKNQKDQKPVNPKLKRLTTLSFIPDVEAMKLANAKGFEHVKNAILGPLAEPILEKRIKLVDEAWKEMEKHKDWLLKVQPRNKARFSANKDDEFKRVAEPEFDEDQVNDILKHEQQHNKIAEAYNKVVIEANEESFKKLEEALKSNKCKQ